MKKDKTNIILVIVAIVVVVICSFATSSVKKDGKGLETSSSNNTNAVVQRAQAESAAVSEDERKEFAESSIDHYLSLYTATDKKRLFLVASPTCGYCQVAEPIIENIAYKYDIKIYYLDSSVFSSDDQKRFIESNEAFSSGFGTPMLLLVSEGKIHDSVDGLTDTEGYMEFFRDNGFISE